ncbi:MAG: hypothetical protein Q8M23_01790, partial [Bacteroidales bacterium]|nr:hypothetical protein [Bacteroidales bacterium]
SILEEILMGEEMPVYEEQPEYVEIEPELVPEYKAALEYQQEVLTRTKHTEHERKPIDYQSIIEHSEPATVYGVANSETKNAFNLRQAVIYSVILERPYR